MDSDYKHIFRVFSGKSSRKAEGLPEGDEESIFLKIRDITACLFA